MKYLTATALMVLGVGVSFESHAHHIKAGFPYYTVCMTVGANGADQAPKVRFIGTNGSTGFLSMDNTGPHDRNDFEANQDTCVEFNTRQAGMSDVGPILALELDASHMTDDLWYSELKVWRMKDGNVLKGANGQYQYSYFPNPGELGDDGNAVSSVHMDTVSTGLVYIEQPPKGRWVRTGSSRQTQNFELEQTLTSNSGQTLSSESKRVLTSSIESKLEFEGIGELSSKLETSIEKTKTSGKSSNEGKTVTIKQSCGKTFEQVGRPNIWQWENSVVANSFNVSVRSCDFACTRNRTPPNGIAGDFDLANSCDIQ